MYQGYCTTRGRDAGEMKEGDSLLKEGQAIRDRCGDVTVKWERRKVGWRAVRAHHGCEGGGVTVWWTTPGG